MHTHKEKEKIVLLRNLWESTLQIIFVAIHSRCLSMLKPQEACTLLSVNNGFLQHGDRKTWEHNISPWSPGKQTPKYTRKADSKSKKLCKLIKVAVITLVISQIWTFMFYKLEWWILFFDCFNFILYCTNEKKKK